jgi:hypothetical protein
MSVDVTLLTDLELADLQTAVHQERGRRQTKATAARELRKINRAYLDADGRQSGDAWVQPTGAHDAYPNGWIVTHNGLTWVALHDGAAHEPGVSGWRELVSEGYPAWIQPLGAHDAYRLGESVTHNGKNWESLIEANVGEPGISGWSEIVPEGEPPAAWIQPTGGHDAYALGAQVTHNGFIWTSLVDANVWEPSDAVPSLWEKSGPV